jgi:hypothetical protein
MEHFTQDDMGEIIRPSEDEWRADAGCYKQPLRYRWKNWLPFILAGLWGAAVMLAAVLLYLELALPTFN